MGKEQNMHIIYIANVRFPTEKAHGIQIAKMIEAFIENGLSVELIVPKRRNEITVHPTVFYNLRIDATDPRLVISRVWVPTLCLSSRLGFFLSSLVFGVTSVFAVRKKKGIIYSIDCDSFSFFAIPFLRRPYFFEIHSNKKNTFFQRHLFHSISGVIAINKNVKSALLKAFPNLLDKVIVHPNGVDQRFYREERTPLSLQRPALVYTGSFQDWKGLDTVLAAAKIVPQCMFYLVGGVEHDLRKGGYQGPIPTNVVLAGKREYKEMPHWTTSADMLVLTGTKRDNYSYHYTSPMKLFEYMASGKPIVASRTPAIEQIVTERDVFFYESDHPEALAETIQRVLENPDEAVQRAEHTLQKVKNFTWDRRAKKIIAFIQRQKAFSDDPSEYNKRMI